MLCCKVSHLQMVAFHHVGAGEADLIPFLKFKHLKYSFKHILQGIADAQNFEAPLFESIQLTEIFICKERAEKEMCLLTVEDYKNDRLSIFKIHNYISLMRSRLVFEKYKSDCSALY